MTTTFSLTSPDTFAFTVVYNDGTPAIEPFTGSLAGAAGTGIDRVQLFNGNGEGGSERDIFFNNLSIVPVPEPTVAAAAAAVFGLAALGRRRDRRVRRAGA
jgi:uncharacterized protein (TIGR03382 family)